ncbi:unnamed protein product [Prorocentrum cordatum]|uniref:Uncharacterized protein n=1 Tax=Prorocentrum cordatum TaxID=2364126 RepID=A0ABN9RB48_9DINO|nr:unnamed protein product [Polarella glacialis]
MYDGDGMDSSTNCDDCVPRSLAGKDDDQESILVDMRADLISTPLDKLSAVPSSRSWPTVARSSNAGVQGGRGEAPAANGVPEYSTNAFASAHVRSPILQEKRKEERVNSGSPGITRSVERFDVFLA